MDSGPLVRQATRDPLRAGPVAGGGCDRFEVAGERWWVFNAKGSYICKRESR